MFSQEFTQGLVEGLVMFATDLLLPFMLTVFAAAIVLKALVYFNTCRMDWFTKEFEKRVNRDVQKFQKEDKHSFFIRTKYLLEKTYYEVFEMRRIMKMRNPDHINSLTDRLFMIQHGSAKLVNDIQKRIRHINKEREVNILEISKSAMSKNVYFNNVFGLIPARGTNDLLNILAGVFIVGGIFGTFLGIMKALPELGNMDLNDVEGTKLIMDAFLLKISFSMSTSIIGIVLSVSMTFINAMFSPEKRYYNAVNRLNDSLSLLWDFTKTNILPEEIENFQESRDELELLAEDAVQKEIEIERKLFQLKKFRPKREAPATISPITEFDDSETDVEVEDEIQEAS